VASALPHAASWHRAPGASPSLPQRAGPTPSSAVVPTTSIPTSKPTASTSTPWSPGTTRSGARPRCRRRVLSSPGSQMLTRSSPFSGPRVGYALWSADSTCSQRDGQFRWQCAVSPRRTPSLAAGVSARLNQWSELGSGVERVLLLRCSDEAVGVLLEHQALVHALPAHPRHGRDVGRMARVALLD
jgi:hypothetical protein